MKFKDDIFLQDQIFTRENSIVRVLLGGKALVTIRELSTFTVTEEPGRAVVDLQSGKLALAVAKRLLRPGESVEVRTPNAIAAVRGTKALWSVTPTATLLQVLEGLVEVFSKLAPTVGQQVKAGEVIDVTDKLGAARRARALPRAGSP